ncbi:hypothetical protein D3C84_568310 [compost metagenome]
MIVVLVLVMLVDVLLLGVAVRRAEVTQVQAGQFLHGQAGSLAAFQHPRQEHFQVRADPVQQLRLAYPADVGGAQRVVVRRGARRQQHLGRAGAVLHGGGDQLQRLDAGQHADLGQRRGGQQPGQASSQCGGGQQRRQTGHDGITHGGGTVI